RDACAAAGDVTHELVLLRTDGTEQDGAQIAVEHLRNRREVGRLATNLDLVGGQLGDEAPEPETVQIGGRGRSSCFSLLDDVHAPLRERGLYRKQLARPSAADRRRSVTKRPCACISDRCRSSTGINVVHWGNC